MMNRSLSLFRCVFGTIALVAALWSSAQVPPPAEASREGLDTTALLIRHSIKPAPEAVLVIAQRPIITLRSEVLGNSPDQRITNIQARLDEALERGAPCVLTSTEMWGGRSIMLDGASFMYISALDIDPTQGEEMDAVLTSAKERLVVAIGEYKELHDSRAMTGNIAFVLLYTALFFGVLYVLGRSRRWIRRKAEALIENGAARSGLKGGLQRSQSIFLLAQRLVILVIGVLMLIATYFWLTAVLGRIPITRVWGDQMYAILSRSAAWVLDGVLAALPGMGMVLFIWLVTRWVVNAINALLTRIQKGELELGWLDPATAAPTKRIISVVIWLFALTLAYPYIPGSHSDAFKGVSVLTGLMLSMGGSSVVAQAASGIVLMYTRRVRLGEYVNINDKVTGTVKRIGYFSTVIVTGYQEEVSVPNSEVLGNKIINFTRHGGPGIMFTTGVTIGYDAPWRQVHAMLLEAASRTESIVTDPLPVINQHTLNDFYVDYRITVVINGRVRPTLTALHSAILDVFNENGVQIMSPHYMGDPSAAKVVAPEMQDPALRRSGAMNSATT